MNETLRLRPPAGWVSREFVKRLPRFPRGTLEHQDNGGLALRGTGKRTNASRISFRD